MFGTSNRQQALDRIKVGLTKPSQWKTFVRDCEAKDVELAAQAAEDAKLYEQQVNDLMDSLLDKLRTTPGVELDDAVYQSVVAKVKVFAYNISIYIWTNVLCRRICLVWSPMHLLASLPWKMSGDKWSTMYPTL